MKICKICGIEKELTEFFVARTNKDGRENKCADCRNKIKRQQYLDANPEFAAEEKAKEAAPDGYKYCLNCKNYKLIEDFYKKLGSVDGLRTWCIPCINKQNNDAYENSDRKSWEADDLRKKIKASPEGFHYCKPCGVYKTVDNFYKAKECTNGLRPMCIECHSKDGAKRWEEVYKGTERVRVRLRREGIKRTYNITLEDYDRMLEEQNFACAICSIHISELDKSLCIDHDHKCCPGKDSCGNCIRGLLCNLCNTGLGMFRDSPELMNIATDYIAKDYVIIERL